MMIHVRIQELEDRVARLEAQLSGNSGELRPSPAERRRPRTDELRADRQTVLKHRDSGNI